MKAASLELNAVIARVPLMPTSQSASERLVAASDNGCMVVSSRKAAKPSRMAPAVMDCSQRRWMDCFGFRVADDVAENQLPFTPGVAGIDKAGHVLALDEPRQDSQPRFAFFNRLQIKVRRDDGQTFESPLARAASTLRAERL